MNLGINNEDCLPSGLIVKGTQKWTKSDKIYYLELMNLGYKFKDGLPSEMIVKGTQKWRKSD